MIRILAAVILLILSGCTSVCPMACSDYVNPVSCPKPIALDRPVLAPAESGAPNAEIQRALVRMMIDLEGYASRCEKALDAYR